MSAQISTTHTTVITIDGKSYEVNCPPDEVDALHNAAAHLDDRIRTFRQGNGSNMPLERLAVITALNMTHEHIEQDQQIDRLLKITSECLTA